MRKIPEPKTKTHKRAEWSGELSGLLIAVFAPPSQCHGLQRRMPFNPHLVFFMLLLFATPGWVSAQTQSSVPGYHPGYVLDVDYERSSRVEEFNIFASQPQKPTYDDYSDAIFDSELTREFKFRYEQQFGRSAVERSFVNPGRFDEYFYQTAVGVTLEEDLRLKRQFGEYMVKRLGEHHVDRYAKSRPALRSVYELKDRLSKVNVEVRNGFKMRMRYSLSGNFFQVRIKNPYNVDTRIFMQMDPAAFGPGEVIDTRLSFNFHPMKTYRVNTDYFIEREGGRFTGTKEWGDGVSTSITLSRFPENLTRGQRGETLGILGIAWTQ